MAALDSHAKDLSLFWKGEILWQTPMSQFSTLRVGGPADAIIAVENRDRLTDLVHWLIKNDINWWIVGRGSNILVPDAGLPGVVIILTGDFNAIERIASPAETGDPAKIFVRAGGGCSLPRLVSYCLLHGLCGLEFAVGIPGSIGGAIVMNAGAWGHEIGSFLHSATLMDNNGEIFSEKSENLGFSYRKWGLGPHTVVLDATFALMPGKTEDIKSQCQHYQELRRKNQPVAEPSAGSFFKNPPEQSAGRLIEEAGLKGYRVGNAKISEKHANFIVNTGQATASDILALMRVVQETVYKKSGIMLEPEVHILGGEGDRV